MRAMLLRHYDRKARYQSKKVEGKDAISKVCSKPGPEALVLMDLLLVAFCTRIPNLTKQT